MHGPSPLAYVRWSFDLFVWMRIDIAMEIVVKVSNRIDALF